jgi:ATP-dependent Clp protease ATP-binding subunit ClpX
VAAKALERKTGARGLRNVLEAVMLDIMYALPSRQGVKDCLINRAVIEKGREPVYLLEHEDRAAS